MTMHLLAGLTDAIVPNPSDLELWTYWNWSSDTLDNIGMHYDIDWGDGSAHLTDAIGGPVLVNRVSLPQRVTWDFHNYLVPGTYTITVHFTATWPADYSSGHFYPDIDETATITVTVREPETIDATPSSGTAPIAVTLGGTFLLPVPIADKPVYVLDPPGTYPITLNWGDGSALETGSANAVPYPRGFLYDLDTFTGAMNLTHTYAEGGTNIITFSVFPAEGGAAFVTKTFEIDLVGKVPLNLSARPGAHSYAYD